MFGVMVFVCGASLANGLENLALGGKAYQTNTKFAAHRAINDNIHQHSLRGKSCTETYATIGAWWEVDLGDIYYIDSVKVYNRKDCCGQRLSDVQLYIGNRHGMSNYVLRGYHPGAVGFTYTFQINPAVYGRWVRITRVGDHHHLALCEVQVFGQKTTRKSPFNSCGISKAVQNRWERRYRRPRLRSNQDQWGSD